MRLARAGVGGRGAVAAQHRPRPPPGQAHQVHLGAALGKLLVGEGMAALVGVLRQGEAGATCEQSPYNASRPALRAAACGGRPRAGSDATVTGEPTAPWREALPPLTSSARLGRDEPLDEVERGLRDLLPAVVDGQRVAAVGHLPGSR